MKKKFLAILIMATMVLSLAACKSEKKEQKSDSTKSQEKEYVSESEISNVFSSPDKYKGKYIKLTGKIFSGPDKEEDVVAYQAWHDITNFDKDFVFGLENDDSYVINDYITVDGEITGAFEGENMVGGKIVCPLILAEKVEKMTYMDAVVPTISELTPENAVAEQNGLSLKVDKVEFADKETRVYMTETNSSADKCSVRTYDIKILQNGQQINQDQTSASSYEGGYAELPYDILPNASASGVIVFPAMDSSASFQIHAEAHSDNWEVQFSPFTIDVPVQ